ncbi:PHP domain-containing protein [Saccharothrix variisporea]|uniref:Histidinol-phosphatase n=1 Tax=Saccharothrix variisporea TaxID=543527 RepID=A0A495X9J8_9PSEU|nr:PHP domain-containing protein [Saccharothrix variisporea]RKT69815.1 histidinol-phosphatase (PHP family) [Saccharothrix variisporea]
MHTEWSWDTVLGSMEASCTRAVELGLPSVAFTEHADLTPWRIPDELVPRLPEHFRVRLRPDGVLEAPDLDVRGYLECVQRCRERFPGLRVLSGVELSEPHWHPDRTAELLRAGEFDRVLGSVHALRHDGGAWEAETLHGRVAEADLMRDYLGEVLRLVESSAPFAVLAHIDYPVRSWPTADYDPHAFEDEFRTVLRALAAGGRALEVNTKVPLHAEVVRWWREAGGDAVAFGSDAHEPTVVGKGFEQAAALVEAHGFRPGRTHHDLWYR